MSTRKAFLHLTPAGATRRQRFGYWLVRVLALFQAWLYIYVIRDHVWVSADGRVRLVSNLETSHLINIEALCSRRGQETPHYIREELAKRPVRIHRRRR